MKGSKTNGFHQSQGSDFERRDFLRLVLSAAGAAAAAPLLASSKPGDPLHHDWAGWNGHGRRFTFFHISDSHFSPYLDLPADWKTNEAWLNSQRSYAAMRRIVEQSKLAQLLPEREEKIGAPAFMIHTGDVAEFGFPKRTREFVNHALDDLEIPIYAVMGNHDNTWCMDYEHWERKHGGPNYAFWYQGVRFLNINSAGYYDPLPAFPEETRRWLIAELLELDERTPIIVSWHHPPDHTGFASRWDVERMLEPLRARNTVAILVGHYHQARHDETWGFDVVHGGCTFYKNGTARPGYNIVRVEGDQIEFAYREVPAPDQSPVFDPENSPARIFQRSILPGARNVANTPYNPLVPDELPTQMPVHTSYRLQLPSAVFRFPPGLGAAGYSRAVMQNRRVAKIFERHGSLNSVGEVTRTYPAFDFLPGSKNAWPLFSGELGYKYKGSIAKEKISAPYVSYGSEVIKDKSNNRHFVSTYDGKLISLKPSSDEPLEALWVNDDANYGYEQAPVLASLSDGRQVLLASAWDGLIYCVDCNTGETIWSAPSPRNQERVIRYYGGADTQPVVVGNLMFACDRGYWLGKYDLDTGDYIGKIAEDTSAFTKHYMENALYLRRTKQPICKIDLDGNILWESTFIAGRIPLSPNVSLERTDKDPLKFIIFSEDKLRHPNDEIDIEYVGGKLTCCNDTGRAAWIDAFTGEILASYQATPEAYVMAAKGSGNTIRVGSLDGTIAYIDFQQTVEGYPNNMFE